MLLIIEEVIVYSFQKNNCFFSKIKKSRKKTKKKHIIDIFDTDAMIYFYFPLGGNHRGSNCLQIL